MSLGELYDDLENHLTADAPDGQPDGVPFVVDSLERADWAARKVARARRILAEAELVAEAEQRRIGEWIDDRRARCEQDTEFLLGLLESYHRKRLDDDPKVKTISLPGGATLVARKSPDSLVVEDEAAAIEWCHEFCSAAVVVTERLDKPTLKRAVGLIDAPGVRLQAGEVTFKVKTDEAD